MSLKALALAVENISLVPENGVKNNLTAIFAELVPVFDAGGFKTASFVAQRFVDTLGRVDGDRLASAMDGTHLDDYDTDEDDSIDDEVLGTVPESTVTVTRGKRQLTVTALYVNSRWVILDAFDEHGQEEVLTVLEKETVIHALQSGHDETGR